MKTKIEIKSIFGAILFEYECEDNTIAKTVIEAVSKKANLTCADLTGADLTGANLRDANLTGANLTGANLRDANLTGANLRCANLRCANLTGADLRYADLTGAKLDNNFPYHLFNNLPEGLITGYKKVRGEIITLLIPKEAKRCHAIGYRKCRAEYAIVMDISNDLTEILNPAYTPYVLYKKGDRVVPDGYNQDVQEECGQGINFFITKQEAEDYN
jgi:Family of unknown function (DUF5758)/Pentapeptide repeats (8 copies)